MQNKARQNLWQKNEDVTKNVLLSISLYRFNFQNILDCYGIKAEGELFSGHFTSLRNRISDRDRMTWFNFSLHIRKFWSILFSPSSTPATPLNSNCSAFSESLGVNFLKRHWMESNSVTRMSQRQYFALYALTEQRCVLVRWWDGIGYNLL